jgi:long-chain acyl-CoA synthetase
MMHHCLVPLDCNSRIFCYETEKSYTYEELLKSAEFLRCEFQQQRKSRTALLAPNSFLFVSTLLAAWSEGVPLYLLSHKSSAAETADQIRKLGIATVFYHPECLPLLQQIENEINTICLTSGQVTTLAPAETVDEMAPAIFQSTSGSTGRPKLTGRSRASLLSEIDKCEAILDFCKEDIIYCPAPFFHAYGLVDGLLSGMRRGSAFYFADMAFTRRQFLNLKKSKSTIIISTPAYYRQLLHIIQRDENPHPELRMAISAGAPIDDQTMNDFHTLFSFYITNIYGMTELGTVLVSNQSQVSVNELAGVPLPGYQVEFFENQEMGVAKPVNDYHLFTEAIREQCVNGDFYMTGDTGFMRDGAVYINGRISDFINVGGEKVAPAEILELMEELEAFKEGCVIGIPHKIYGQIIGLYVQVEMGRELTKSEILTFLSKRLPPHKQPAKILVSQHPIPKTATGKILRGRILEFFEKNKG